MVLVSPATFEACIFIPPSCSFWFKGNDLVFRLIQKGEVICRRRWEYIDKWAPYHIFRNNGTIVEFVMFQMKCISMSFCDCFFENLQGQVGWGSPKEVKGTQCYWYYLGI